jgi:hypothetical protein
LYQAKRTTSISSGKLGKISTGTTGRTRLPSRIEAKKRPKKARIECILVEESKLFDSGLWFDKVQHIEGLVLASNVPVKKFGEYPERFSKLPYTKQYLF